MPDRFFRSLNYASVNEDWRTEACALRPGADDTVLCVTGSGARPLDLLATTPARILAVDANPAQSHLLALKTAALRRLGFEDYASFLGLREAEPRWRRDRLQDLLPEVPAESRAFWQGRASVVAAGVLYQGRWERYYRRVSVLARRLRPRAVPALFAFDDLGAQRRFVDEVWDTPAWRSVFRFLCSPWISRLAFGDPAFYRGVMRHPGDFLYGRMCASLRRHVARDNFMVSLLLRGRLPEYGLPPHLTPEGVALLRERLDRLEARTGNVVDLLAQAPEGAFTRFSLSDMPSFLDGRAFERLLTGLARSGRPGARFCIREFLVRHPWPESARSLLVREPGLEARLAAEDRAFAYDFIVGEVSGHA